MEKQKPGLWDHPTSVMQGNPPLYEENSLWEALSVVSQKWSFPTALTKKPPRGPLLPRRRGADPRHGPLLRLVREDQRGHEVRPGRSEGHKTHVFFFLFCFCFFSVFFGGEDQSTPPKRTLSTSRGLLFLCGVSHEDQSTPSQERASFPLEKIRPTSRPVVL